MPTEIEVLQNKIVSLEKTIGELKVSIEKSINYITGLSDKLNQLASEINETAEKIESIGEQYINLKKRIEVLPKTFKRIMEI